MLNFAKVSAASEGALIRAYMTQDKPEPETLKVHGVSIDGRDLETGERLTAYYTGRGERANWRPDMSPRVAAALGVARSGPTPATMSSTPSLRRGGPTTALTGASMSGRILALISCSPPINPCRLRPNSRRPKPSG